MRKSNSIIYKDLNISICFGDYEIRIVHIAYLMPTPDWQIRMHEHHCFELHYIPFGTGSILVGEECHSVFPNLFYLVGPHVAHEQHASCETPMSEYGLNFEIIPRQRTASSHASDIDLQKEEKNRLVTTLLNTRFHMNSGNFHFAELFEFIKEELETQYLGYSNNIQSSLSSILVLLMRSCICNQKSDYVIPSKTLNTKRQLLIHNYLTNCYQTATKKELSNLLGISVRQLTRQIKTMYPESSFQKMLISIRLQHARFLLEHTSCTMEEISEKTGFSTVSYFCSVFKKLVHTTPSNYRDHARRIP